MMKYSGFTLVELMIVVAIVGILVALALPNYQDSVRKPRRTDAQADLLEFAGNAERIFTQENSYLSVDDDGGIKPANTTYYVYSFPSAATGTTYTLRATPTDVQNEDGCGTMTLAQTGEKTYTGSQSGCW